MGKIVEDRTTTTTSRVVVRRTCDLCGRESLDPNSWSREWGRPGDFDTNTTQLSVEVRQREGTNYPEGGSGKLYEVDLCPQCFRDKLVPWLESQGAKVEQTEWDW